MAGVSATHNGTLVETWTQRGNITLELWPCGGARAVAREWDIEAATTGETGGAYVLGLLAGALRKAAADAREDAASAAVGDWREAAKAAADAAMMEADSAVARAWADELEVEP